ncbi:Rad52/Rad22 family DNA repair protein [Streptomyces sp. SRF1]|uniref:Rad52/Rad22 family DNA repair protein n=1 Tax=Streptomyces sp. SRF1 TaxID=1549642 RepID=UPI0025AFBDB0|nr:Rad52/Rad22 family DNA repair protein [Streptomyces sp. SRF1]MDN3056207.1 Rad52/Rad22 family DNA repair protein [Streptomyces sp. SRF1]
MTVIPLERRAVPATAGPSDLTADQVKTLFAPINPGRVQNLRGQSHLEAWDVRRWLNRVFGFGGWADETLELACVAQVEINPGRWTVIYRAQVRLTVKTTDGRVLTTYDDAAMGDSRNQPALGDAHDQAMKTALSQALKRCAHNLGDQFGLSLYNDGSRNPVGLWSAAHALPKDADDDALPDDEPVKPEPAPQVEQAPAEGQVRRSKLAEAGPWEQQPAGQQRAERPAAQQQAPASNGPSRDYLAEAQRAQSREQFDQVRAAAVAEGAPQHYLAKLDAIAQRKEQAPKQSAHKGAAKKTTTKKATAKKPAARGRTAKGAPAADAARQQHAVALAELLAAGAPLGLSAEHLDDITRAEHGQPAAECTVEQLATTTADLLAATEENAA